MYKIVKKRQLNENIYLMDIEAPRVAKSAKPGQFIIVKMDEVGERIPLTICDYEVLEHMVFPVLVLGLLGLACEIDAQNFIIEYFAHCRYQLVIDDLLLRDVYMLHPICQANFRWQILSQE